MVLVYCALAGYCLVGVCVRCLLFWWVWLLYGLDLGTLNWLVGLQIAAGWFMVCVLCWVGCFVARVRPVWYKVAWVLGCCGFRFVVVLLFGWAVAGWFEDWWVWVLCVVWLFGVLWLHNGVGWFSWCLLVCFVCWLS